MERIIGTGDCLVSVQRASAMARFTGIEFDLVYACLWRFRGGKVIYCNAFIDPQEAIKAAGLQG